MNFAALIIDLEDEWSLDTGFFGHVRSDNFVESEFRRLLAKLEKLRFAELVEPLPVRVVSLLWYMPLFMQWQTERVAEVGGDPIAYNSAVARVTNEVERILGVP